MSARSGKRRGRPPKTPVADRSSSSRKFEYHNMKKPKYLQNSDSQFSTPSASRASSPQNSDDGLASRRTSGRASARRSSKPAASATKRGGHSAATTPASQGRRAYESEYHYGSDFGDSSDDQEPEDDPFLASATDSDSLDAVEDDNDSDFSMNSYSTNNANRGAPTSRQPTPDPVWLQDIEVPPLEIPRSSDDLMAPQHLILRITSLYEVLRRFRNIVRLSPFRIEDFCAALTCEEQSSLLSEIHMMLLKAIIREEDTQATHFGPLDQKDSVNISLYLMDSFTWPEIMRCYVESDAQFDEGVLEVLTNNEYPFCPIDDRMRVLQFLVDQLLITTPVRDMLLQEGPIHYDDHCRICHRLGDLLCCETCPAVYHLECVEPPLTDVPSEDWQCNMCKDHKVSGVNDCMSQQEKHAMLVRQDHLGYDRHGRKYWFVCRRLFVETEDGSQIWYYSTVAQFNALLLRLDEGSLEEGLCMEIEEQREEIVRHMELTEALTNQHKGGKKSYLEMLNERMESGEEVGTDEDAMEEARGDEAGRMTRNRLQQISTGTLFFKLGMENTFKTYENHFGTNVNALNKPQRNEERDKKRHLSHKFSLTEASEFKWSGGSSTSVNNMVLALRGTMMHLEQNIPAPYMHPNWVGLKKIWTQAATSSESPKELMRLLIVLQACMKSCLFANVWCEALGHTRLYRITSNEREEKKKQEKRDRREYTDEEDRHRWAYNFVKYTLGMRHQCWKQKGEEYRLHGQWSWLWLSANRREKLGKVKPQFHITPERIMTKVRTVTENGEQVQMIGVSPVTHERLTECFDVQEDFDATCGILCVVQEHDEDRKPFNYIDVSAALTSASRSLYPKLAKKSRLDVLLARRTALLEAEEKAMAAATGPADLEDAIPKQTIVNLPNIPCTEADLLRVVGETVRPGTTKGSAAANKAASNTDALATIMKEVIPIRTLFSQLNKLAKNSRCYSKDCVTGPQLVLTKPSNCYSPLCMQKDRARQDLLDIVRKGHSLGINSKDMLNNKAMTSFEQQQAQERQSEVDETGILELPVSAGGDKKEEVDHKMLTDADDLAAMVAEVKLALSTSGIFDEAEYNECLTKKAYETEMEAKAIEDVKRKEEAVAKQEEEEKNMSQVPVKMEVDGIKKEPTEEGGDPLNESGVDLDKSTAPAEGVEPPKRSLRGRPPKPKNLKLKEERAAAAAALLAENGGDTSVLLKNGFGEEKTHKWSVLKPKRRFMKKDPKVLRSRVKVEPELGPNGAKRVYSAKCTQGRIQLRKQLKAKPPTTGVILQRGTKGRITNKLPIVCNFMAKTGRRSILVLAKHELLHIARSGGRYVPLGYNPNAKTNIAVWPYPSPRPLFKTSWVYRMFHATSLNSLCLGLRVMWTCLRWDDMQTKPPTLDGKHQVMTENEIINTELLKHRHMGRHMEYTQYLRRRVIIPLELPKAVREVTSIRLGLRKRKRADSPQHTEPQVTEEWIGEEKMELWEIRQYGERLDRANVLPVTRQTTGKLPPARQYDVNQPGKTMALTGKSSEEIKEKLEQQLRMQRAVLNQKRAQESKGIPGTSTPKQVVKTRQIQVRQPDGSIRIIQQQIVSAPAPVKPPDQKVQILRTADGKLSVKGLVAGQQLIQMPDGKIHIVNTQNNATVKTVVARPPGTPGQQLIIRPSPGAAQTPGTKTVIQKILTPGTPNILQKTPQAKVIGASKVEGASPATPGQSRVVTTSLQQLLAQNPGQKIVLNQGTPNQRILIANPSTAAQPQQTQQVLVQQPSGQVVQQIVLNSGQRIIAGATPVKATTTPTSTQIQVQSPAQPAQQTNGSIAQQLASGKLRMVNHNGQQVIVKPLNNNSAMIIAHVKHQENGPAQIVVTPQAAAAAAASDSESEQQSQLVDGEAEEDMEGTEEVAGGSATPSVQPVVKTITAQILQTANGPRIVLQGLGQDELTQQQLAEVQQQVKAQLMKAQDANNGATGPTKLQITLFPQQPPPLTPVQGGAKAGAGQQTTSGGGGGGDGDGSGEDATGGSGGAAINSATKKSIVQKVMARAGQGANKLLLSPVKPGQIIKFEGQSIVGKSNNNAIVQAAATTSAAAASTTASADDTDGDNDFKITPDYIQETIKNALRQHNLNPDIEEKLLNLQRYQEQQVKDGADAPFTYTPIQTTYASTTSSTRKRVVRKHHDDSDDDLDDELDDGAIPEDDDEDWFAHKRRRKPYVPKTDRKSLMHQRNMSPYIKPKQQDEQRPTPLPRPVPSQTPRPVIATPAATTHVPIKPQPQLVTLKPKQPVVCMPASQTTAKVQQQQQQQKVMKVQHQNATEKETEPADLSEILANESEKLRDDMLKKRESLEQVLKKEVDQEFGSTLQEMKQNPNQENEKIVENNANKYTSTRKRASGAGVAAATAALKEAQAETPAKAARMHSTSKGGRSTTSTSNSATKKQRSHSGSAGGGTPATHPSSSRKKEKLYCICQTPYDEERFYVGCDMCNNWFHGSCVGISSEAGEEMSEYICDGCKHAKEAQELYCLCRKPYDESQFYICCDKCQDWFHGRCVGVQQKDADSIDEYICPNCMKNDSVSAVNAKPLSAAEFEHLKRLMKQITGHKSAWPFLEAVDPQEAPDYYKVVTDPMDLSKVESRLDSRWYKTLSDFIGDMTKIFDNCRFYNPKESQFYKLAEGLEAFFLQRIKQFRESIGGA